MSDRRASILVVDDDEVDVMVLQRAFKRRHIENPIHVASDGIEALEMIRGDSGRSAIPTPIMVLLDLNMPRMNRIEFLDQIRSDPALKHTVVFVLTTSASDQDVCAAYDKQVAGYLLKTGPADDAERTVEMLENYWNIVEFPR